MVFFKSREIEFFDNKVLLTKSREWEKFYSLDKERAREYIRKNPETINLAFSEINYWKKVAKVADPNSWCESLICPFGTILSKSQSYLFDGLSRHQVKEAHLSSSLARIEGIIFFLIPLFPEYKSNLLSELFLFAGQVSTPGLVKVMRKYKDYREYAFMIVKKRFEYGDIGAMTLADIVIDVPECAEEAWELLTSGEFDYLLDEMLCIERESKAFAVKASQEIKMIKRSSGIA